LRHQHIGQIGDQLFQQLPAAAFAEVDDFLRDGVVIDRFFRCDR
jgi:hypothetical protein